MAIPSGSIFSGRVAEVRRAKSPQGGELSLRIEVLELDESKIPVEGYVADPRRNSQNGKVNSVSEDSMVAKENTDRRVLASLLADPGDDIRLDPDTELVIALAAELRIPLE